MAESIVGIGDVWPTGGAFKPLTDCLSGDGCANLLFEGGLPSEFLILTLILGGGCAIMAARSVALEWRTVTTAMLYGVLLAFATRFLHYGLLRGTLMSPWYYLVDAATLVLLAYGSWRFTRSAQMARQYPWKYERSGPFGWREKGV